MHLHDDRRIMAVRPRRERKSYQVFSASVIDGYESFDRLYVAKSVQESEQEIIQTSTSEKGLE